MGSVYRAEDPDGRTVALKLVRSQVLYDVERRERFLQGILATSLVHHEGICPILEIGDENDDFFLVMPYIEGKTLEQVLDRKPVPWRRAVDIATAVGQALSAAHAAGAIHRGLKPSNIWLRRNGAIIVSDCSVARFTELTKRTLSRSAGPRLDFADTLIPLAALTYMSPEQVRGDPVDPRTDVFSLGVILYEMLTGRHPFEARNSLSRMSAILEAEPPQPTSRIGSIPPELSRIVRKALAKSLPDRYGSMESFLSELKAVRQSDAMETSPPCQERRSSAFRTFCWIAALAAILVAIVTLAYFRLRS